MKTKLSLLMFLVPLFLFSNLLLAGELYRWEDKNGVAHITDTPPPQGAKVFSQEVTPDYSREELEQFRSQRETEKRKYRQDVESRAQAARAQRAQQEARDKRADKVIADNKARIEALRRSGIALPRENIVMLEKAAEAKAAQIREGTDRPMSPSEDAAFHAKQAAESAIQWHKIMDH